jgi:general secretion pathway protein G
MKYVTRFGCKSTGFTLIEVLVVVVILSILAALIVPQIMDRPDEARVVAAKSDIRAITSALKLYRLDNGVYPSTEQGLQAMVKSPRPARSSQLEKQQLSRPSPQGPMEKRVSVSQSRIAW